MKGEKNMNDEYWITWAKAAGVRALKTIAQTALASITVGAAANELDWMRIASVSLVAGVASLLTSVAGLPEVPTDDTEGK